MPLRFSNMTQVKKPATKKDQEKFESVWEMKLQLMCLHDVTILSIWSCFLTIATGVTGSPCVMTSMDMCK